jgi:hypothetical protein
LSLCKVNLTELAAVAPMPAEGGSAELVGSLRAQEETEFERLDETGRRKLAGRSKRPRWGCPGRERGDARLDRRRARPRDSHGGKEGLMFSSTALEVGLSLVLIYIVLSIIVRGATDLLATMFNWRGATLRAYVGGFLGEDLAQAVYAHPLIFSVTGERTQSRRFAALPGYPPRSHQTSSRSFF